MVKYRTIEWMSEWVNGWVSKWVGFFSKTVYSRWIGYWQKYGDVWFFLCTWTVRVFTNWEVFFLSSHKNVHVSAHSQIVHILWRKVKKGISFHDSAIGLNMYSVQLCTGVHKWIFCVYCIIITTEKSRLCHCFI